MRKPSLKTIAMAAALATVGPARAGDIWPTSEIAEIVELDIPHAVAWAMRGSLGDSGISVGLAAACATKGPH